MNAPSVCIYLPLRCFGIHTVSLLLVLFCCSAWRAVSVSPTTARSGLILPAISLMSNLWARQTMLLMAAACLAVSPSASHACQVYQQCGCVGDGGCGRGYIGRYRLYIRMYVPKSKKHVQKVVVFLGPGPLDTHPPSWVQFVVGGGLSRSVSPRLLSPQWSIAHGVAKVGFARLISCWDRP